MAGRRFSAVASCLAIGVASASCSLFFDLDAVSNGGDGGSPKPFCASIDPPPTFCDDFDRRPLGDIWDAVTGTNGTITTNTIDQIFVSPPGSLVSQSAQLLAGQQPSATVVKEFDGQRNVATSFRIAFEMRVDEYDSSQDAQALPFALVFGPPGNYSQIGLELDVVGGVLRANMAEDSAGPTPADVGYNAHPLTTRPQAGKWMAVKIDVDARNPNGVGNSMRVTLDGAEQAIDPALELRLKGETPRVVLGIGYAKELSKVWRIRFDDFVVQLRSL